MSRLSRRQTFGLGLGAGFTVTMAGAEDAAAAPPPAGFSLLLVNDIYRMGEDKGRGGFARLAAIVKAERARGVPMLYCHAGDTLSPSLMSGFDQGAHIIELTNMAPPDVFVPGNHEFDFGPATYLKRVREARFPVFGANVRAADGTPLPGMKDSQIYDLGPVRVGVVGIALAQTPLKSQSGDLQFLPEIETLRTETARLKREGADILVAVAHTDRETDNAIVRSRLVDVLLSGHDHDLAIGFDGRTVMVESNEEGNFVTAVDFAVTVEGEGRERKVRWSPSFRVHDSTHVEPDPETLAVVTRLEADLSRELDVVLGTTLETLDARTAIVRTRESAVGNLVADAIRASTEADCAITNGGGLRGGAVIAAGAQLTRRDILSLLPFGNTTVLVSITGADIRAALENGVSGIDGHGGRFPQVSGLRIEVDPARPPGARVLSIEVNGEPLDEARRYTVGSNNYMLAGGDGYGMLAKGRTLVGATDGKLLANEVMTFVRRQGIVNARAEGRVVLR
jgi:5'-nucleotidase / UDP-sugar diphosphatase